MLDIVHCSGWVFKALKQNLGHLSLLFYQHCSCVLDNFPKQLTKTKVKSFGQ